MMRHRLSDTSFYASFTDLLALLLVFFIYLNTMNSMTTVSSTIQRKPLVSGDYAPVDMIESTKTLESLVLAVKDHTLFSLGSATLHITAQPALDALAQGLIQHPAKVIISGHTDPRPVSHDIIQSNWHLSALRAASVAHYLEQQGIPKTDLKIIGYAETQPDAIDDRQNRRVDIRLEAL
jgi:flagellar motor protein MotB